MSDCSRRAWKVAGRPILDPCCGSRMFYFDKNDPRVLFCDIRDDVHEVLCDGRTLEVKPDQVEDVTNLPFEDGQFPLVILDPPHLTNAGDGGWQAKKYGVSGTGKTTFGRYVAAMFELPFYYINFSRVIDSHLGSTGSNIAKVFDFVRYTPCVLMLDEIDTVSKRRDGGSNAEGELSRVTVTLMQEFDKLNGHQIVIGATNRIDLIDNALLRRFSMIHEVTVPEDAVEAARVARRLLDDIGEAERSTPRVSYGGRS